MAEHDDRCNAQDQQLGILSEQQRTTAEALRLVVGRVQKLVDDYHLQNVAQATMVSDIAHIRKTVDAIVLSLKEDYAPLEAFVELKGQWNKALGIILSAVLVLILVAVGISVKAGVLR